MTLTVILLVLLIVLVFTGGIPVGDNRNLVATLLIALLLVWLLLACVGPLSYPTRGVYWP